MTTSNNAINNTVGASISGVTNTLTVTNPSNTASSAASEVISVGGATAGDPWLNFNVAGTTDWSIGIDNGSDDSWKLSQASTIGTTDTFVVDTNGQFTQPRQCAFFAVQSSFPLNVTGDGTFYTAIFNSVTYNITSSYDNTTGIFTAPITGIYHFDASLSFTGFTSAHNDGFLSIYKNGGGVWRSTRIDVWNVVGHGNPNPEFGQLNISGDLQLAASDTVQIVLYVAGGSKVVDIQAGAAAFSGRLVL